MHKVVTFILQHETLGTVVPQEYCGSIYEDCRSIYNTRPRAARAVCYEAVQHKCWPALQAFLGAGLYLSTSTRARFPEVNGPLCALLDLMRPHTHALTRAVVAARFEFARVLLCVRGISPGPAIPHEAV